MLVVVLLKAAHQARQSLISLNLVPSIIACSRYIRPFGAMPLGVFVESRFEEDWNLRLELGVLKIGRAFEDDRSEVNSTGENSHREIGLYGEGTTIEQSIPQEVGIFKLCGSQEFALAENRQPVKFCAAETEQTRRFRFHARKIPEKLTVIERHVPGVCYLVEKVDPARKYGTVEFGFSSEDEAHE